VAIDELLLEAGIDEALVVHHMGHSGERARGDSRLRDWPDVEWRLMRQDDDPASPRFLTAYGRDIDVPERRSQPSLTSSSAFGSCILEVEIIADIASGDWGADDLAAYRQLMKGGA
jgi:hypothetical protein